ncbi:hypothetical protein [Rhizobium halophilum]|uniref:hypothetical protein n=1 Tax=Rhizobium halophilum TaxID=2846852 RepID=UPI001EFD8BA9|nr:hypothetical protein [Rhizobium halophilum]MCF6370925.1 hypothetical protein [Rhizobium halophilum]
MSGIGRGGETGGLDEIDIIRSASERVAANPDGASDLEHDMILRIVSLLYEAGMVDPQKLADAAFLLGSSKLFTGML